MASKQVPAEVLEQAIALKQESPTRSVRQIMAMLELARLVTPGVLKESTLSRQLRRRGATRKALATGPGGSFHRFEAEHRNACWQGDVQHTLYLPHPEQPGKKKLARLVAFLDDYSRYVVHGQFYFEERVPRLEDCFKKALLKHALPAMVYVDNGAVYSSHHFARICGRLRIELKHTQPGRPQGRGKLEKFFGFVDQSFVPEAYDLMAQGKLQTLADLNRFFAAWLEVAYHQKVHNTFKQRPADRYHQCVHPLRRVPPHELVEAFLLEETRQVDKTNCLALFGSTYEVEPGLAGEKVQLRFDPYELSVLQVWQDGRRYRDARRLQKRSLRRAPADQPSVSVAPVAPPKTGLNYVELAYEQHLAAQKAKARQGFGDWLQDKEAPK